MRIQTLNEYISDVEIKSERIRGWKKQITEEAMRYAEVNGGCCWEVRSRHPYGGNWKELRTVKTHRIPFDIKSARKINC